jgi:hypothetical protein
MNVIIISGEDELQRRFPNRRPSSIEASLLSEPGLCQEAEADGKFYLIADLRGHEPLPGHLANTSGLFAFECDSETQRRKIIEDRVSRQLLASMPERPDPLKPRRRRGTRKRRWD